MQREDDWPESGSQEFQAAYPVDYGGHRLCRAFNCGQPFEYTS